MSNGKKCGRRARGRGRATNRGEAGTQWRTVVAQKPGLALDAQHDLLPATLAGDLVCQCSRGHWAAAVSAGPCQGMQARGRTRRDAGLVRGRTSVTSVGAYAL